MKCYDCRTNEAVQGDDYCVDCLDKYKAEAQSREQRHRQEQAAFKNDFDAVWSGSTKKVGSVEVQLDRILYDLSPICQLRPPRFARLGGQGQPVGPTLADVSKNCRQTISKALADKNSCLFSGGPGNGKTHALWATLWLVMKKDHRKRVEFIRWARFVKLARANASFNPPGEVRDELRKLLSADVLLLDDLGAISPGEQAMPDIYELLDERYSMRRPTFASTNVAEADLIECVGSALVDRFAIRIRFEGASLRSKTTSSST